MNQQLNLFNPALKPKKDRLSLDNVALATAVVLVVLIILGSWGKHKESTELAKLKAQETQLKATQGQLVELATLQAQRRTDPALEKDVADKKNLLANKQQVLAQLKGGEVGRSEGFSVLMEALARQVPEGLWLTGFDMQSGGQSILLHGGLISESALPQFVQHLNQEPQFRGRYFAAMQVSPVLPLLAPPTGEDNRSFLERSGYLKFSLEGVGVETAGVKETSR